eukprot:Nk52_evm16s249 gene=Nk52_evmTU16s249
MLSEILAGARCLRSLPAKNSILFQSRRGILTDRLASVKIPVRHLNEQELMNPDTPHLQYHADGSSANQPSDPKLLNVSLVGPVNAGKSTLSNALFKRNWTQSSSLPHLTRENLVGIHTVNNLQVVLCDTPGLLTEEEEKKYSFGKRHRTSATRSLASADVALVVLDLKLALGYKKSSKGRSIRWRDLFTRLSGVEWIVNNPDKVLIALNKIDLLDESQKIVGFPQFMKKLDHLLKVELKLNIPEENILLASATKGKGVYNLRKKLATFARPVPWEFKQTCETTTSPLRFITEAAREILFANLSYELPYVVGHETQSMEWVGAHGQRGNRNTNTVLHGLDLLPRGGMGMEGDTGMGGQWGKDEERRQELSIEHVLYVGKESQVRMVLGKNGTLIQAISRDLTHKLSLAFGVHVRLNLIVKKDKKRQLATTTERI